ncbi:MAG TPA: hypothetical protein VFE05_12515 [Longimicrobiaceae bacterium]|jgi:hypothetical protein|nr:hypothetical protein [Longimicrobiaceae bacterium]
MERRVLLNRLVLAAALASGSACGDAEARDTSATPAARPKRTGNVAPVASGWSAPHRALALSGALGKSGRQMLASVAVDPAGTLHALFALDRDRDGRADALEYARLDDTTWSAPQPVVETLGLTDPARIAVDGDGDVHVLWYAHSGTAAARDVPTELVQRVMHGGRWSSPRVLYREPSGSGMNVRWLAAATDARGDVQVLYAPQGRGFGSLSLCGERAGTPRYLDHDGNMMAFSASAAGAPLEVAYIGERVSRERPRAVNDVFVRAMDTNGRWAPSREAYYGPGRYSHYPQLVVDARGVRHLFWLEDTDGSVNPEAVYASQSADGVHWSPPADVTPPSARGGVPLRISAVPDGAGRIHLLLRYATPGVPRTQLTAFTVIDGRASPEHVIARAGEIGPGDAQLAYDARRRHVVALWRAPDGIYRWSTLPTD